MNRDEFESEVRLHLPAILAWASRKVPDKDVAKDLVQDAFLAAYQQLDSFKKDSSFKTWVTGILKFKIADHFRRDAKTVGDVRIDVFFTASEVWVETEEPKEWNADASVFDEPQFLEIWERCLQKLPSQWHRAVNDKYLEEKDAKSICKEMGITTTNYWQLLHRSKLQLRKCLEINWFTS